MAASVSIIMSTFNCNCWTSVTMEFKYLSWVLRPLNIKGQPKHDCSDVALIAQLGEHCTSNAKVRVGIQFRAWKFFQVFFSVVLWLHCHPSSCLYLVSLVPVICKWLIYNINNIVFSGILYSYLEVMWYHQVYCKQSSSIWGGKTDLLNDTAVMFMSGFVG